MSTRPSLSGSVHLNNFKSAASSWSSTVFLSQPPTLTRDLGVTLDTRLSFQQHVDSIVHSCLYQLRQLRTHGQSDIQFQMTPCALLYRCSSQVASTTSALSCMVSLQRSLVGYRQYCTLLITDHRCSLKSAYHRDTA